MYSDDEVRVKEPIRVIPIDPTRHPIKGESPEGDLILRVDVVISVLLVLWGIAYLLGWVS